MDQEMQPNTIKGEIFPLAKEMPAQRRETLPVAEGKEGKKSVESRRTQELVDETDKAFFYILQSRGVDNLERLIDTIDGIEALRYGKELKRRQLGDVSQNSVTQRMYEGSPNRIAYAKTQSGESAYVYDSAQMQWVSSQRRWNEDSQKFAESVKTLNGTEKGLVGVFALNESTFRAQMAAYYGVGDLELPMKPKEFSARIGIETGAGYIREWGASRINELFKLDVVPLTVIRPESSHDELTSVQEAVTVTNPENPPRPMDKALFDELMEQGPAHPAAKSLMRIACLDALIRNLDRHHENLLYNEEKKEFSGIDQGLAFGLSATERITFPNGSEVSYDRVRSLPIEIIRKHPNWKVDSEAQANFSRVYESILDYLKRREARDIGSVSDAADGLEAKFLSKLYRTIFKNEKIATKEAGEFMKRLQKIVEEGRPPEDLLILPIADIMFPPEETESTGAATLQE